MFNSPTGAAVMAPIVLFYFGFVSADVNPLRPFVLIFFTLNGLLNSLVNYGRNENVRRAVRSLIRCQRCCGEVLHISERDYGQRRINLLPRGRLNNRVTVDLRQIARLDLELRMRNIEQSKD